jgi:uncharacterized protein YjbI with pentapeptide repeats
MDLLNETLLQPGWLIMLLPGRAVGASFVLKGTFQLRSGAPAVFAEKPDALDGDVPEAEGSTALKYTRDLTAPKPAVDLLVTGEAFAPGAKPTDMMPVTVKLGGWSKMLAVMGDRRKTQGLLLSKVTPPASFVRMPLTWSRSFGGMNSELNPAGRGLDEEIDEKGTHFIRLPNVVRLNEAGLDVGALKDPAGFGPVCPEWESRAEIPKRAHYGAKWLKERWPAPPEDFDPDFFNAAPIDQRLPHGSVKGDEPVEFHNLHPARPKYESALPGIRPRLFLEDLDPSGKPDAPTTFREIPLKIDTIWADPSADKLVVVWRGFAPVRTKGLKEVAGLVVAVEKMAEPAHPPEHYRVVLAKKREEREKAKGAPPPAPPVFAPLEAPAPEFDWGAWEKQMEEEQKAWMADVEKQVAQNEAETRGAAATLLTKEGIPGAMAMVVPPIDPASASQQMQANLKALEAVDAKAASLLSKAPPAEALDADAQIKKHFDDFEKEFAVPPYPLTGPGAPPGKEPTGKEGEEEEAEEPEWTRERVIAHAAEKKPFLKEDLEGLDLSDLDLSGAVFEDCVLSGCNLTKARLSKTIFRRCALPGVPLAGASMVEAELTVCDLAGADLTGATLDKAVLNDSDCTGAKFDQARLATATARRTTFAGATFAGTAIRECDFRQADFEGATLDGISLGKSNFKSAAAAGARASGCDFEGCDLSNFRGGDGALFVGSIFRGCKAVGSVWEGSVLDKANFSSANLGQANFASTSLKEAKFGVAKLGKARFLEADLSRAEFQKADLFRATFEGAIVDGTDFRLSNAYEAEFLEAKGSAAKFDGTNLKGTKLG